MGEEANYEGKRWKSRSYDSLLYRKFWSGISSTFPHVVRSWKRSTSLSQALCFLFSFFMEQFGRERVRIPDQCDQMAEWKVAQFLLKIAQKFVTVVWLKNWWCSKLLQKSPNIWATFERRFVGKNFKNLRNCNVVRTKIEVTLPPPPVAKQNKDLLWEKVDQSEGMFPRCPHFYSRSPASLVEPNLSF